MGGDTSETPEAIRLSDLCKAENAAGLRDGIMARRGQAVRISGEGVPVLSALAAQVLIAAQRTWRLDGHAFELTDPSEDLVGDLRLLGLTCLIEGEEAECR